MAKITLASSNPLIIGKYGKHGNYESLGIRYLASVLDNEGHDICMIDDFSGDIEARTLEAKADIYGISCFTYQWPFYSKLINKLRNTHPSSKIVLGGYHPSSAIREVIQHPNVDVVVYGEGEETFKELVPELVGGKSLAKIKGIAYKSSGEIRINPPRERISDIDSIPWPIRDQEGINNSKSYGLCYPSTEDQISATVLYSRGCPHACDFCSSPNIWQRKIKWRNPKDVANEIRFLKNDFGVNHLYLADLFFNLSSKKVRSLCEEIKDIDINWFPMVGVTPDLDSYKIMAEAGCSRIGIGVESLDEKTRERIGKSNWTNFEQNLKAAWDSGIIVRLYLMGGYPWDTRESLDSFSDTLKKLPVDDFKISFYTPFPGTPAHEKYKDFITTDDLTKFNTVFDPVVKPSSLSLEEIKEWRGKVFRDFYNSPEYERRRDEKIRRWPHLKKSYESHFSSMRERGTI